MLRHLGTVKARVLSDNAGDAGDRQLSPPPLNGDLLAGAGSFSQVLRRKAGQPAHALFSAAKFARLRISAERQILLKKLSLLPFKATFCKDLFILLKKEG